MMRMVCQQCGYATCPASPLVLKCQSTAAGACNPPKKGAAGRRTMLYHDAGSCVAPHTMLVALAILWRALLCSLISYSCSAPPKTTQRRYPGAAQPVHICDQHNSCLLVEAFAAQLISLRYTLLYPTSTATQSCTVFSQ